MGRSPEDLIDDDREGSPFEIKIAKSASKHLAKMPDKLREAIRDAIDELADPFDGDVRSLTGYNGAYRKRKGDYRILFTVDKASRTVFVEMFCHAATHTSKARKMTFHARDRTARRVIDDGAGCVTRLIENTEQAESAMRWIPAAGRYAASRSRS